jgi:hypothetical protein
LRSRSNTVTPRWSQAAISPSIRQERRLRPWYSERPRWPKLTDLGYMQDRVRARRVAQAIARAGSPDAPLHAQGQGIDLHHRASSVEAVAPRDPATRHEDHVGSRTRRGTRQVVRRHRLHVERQRRILLHRRTERSTIGDRRRTSFHRQRSSNGSVASGSRTSSSSRATASRRQ